MVSSLASTNKLNPHNDKNILTQKLSRESTTTARSTLPARHVISAANSHKHIMHPIISSERTSSHDLSTPTVSTEPIIRLHEETPMKRSNESFVLPIEYLKTDFNEIWPETPSPRIPSTAQVAVSTFNHAPGHTNPPYSSSNSMVSNAEQIVIYANLIPTSLSKETLKTHTPSATPHDSISLAYSSTGRLEVPQHSTQNSEQEVTVPTGSKTPHLNFVLGGSGIRILLKESPIRVKATSLSKTGYTPDISAQTENVLDRLNGQYTTPRHEMKHSTLIITSNRTGPVGRGNEITSEKTSKQKSSSIAAPIIPAGESQAGGTYSTQFDETTTHMQKSILSELHSEYENVYDTDEPSQTNNLGSATVYSKRPFIQDSQLPNITHSVHTVPAAPTDLAISPYATALSQFTTKPSQIIETSQTMASHLRLNTHPSSQNMNTPKPAKILTTEKMTSGTVEVHFDTNQQIFENFKNSSPEHHQTTALHVTSLTSSGIPHKDVTDGRTEASMALQRKTEQELSTDSAYLTQVNDEETIKPVETTSLRADHLASVFDDTRQETTQLPIEFTIKQQPTVLYASSAAIAHGMSDDPAQETAQLSDNINFSRDHTSVPSAVSYVSNSTNRTIQSMLSLKRAASDGCLQRSSTSADITTSNSANRNAHIAMAQEENLSTPLHPSFSSTNIRDAVAFHGHAYVKDISEDTQSNGSEYLFTTVGPVMQANISQSVNDKPWPLNSESDLSYFNNIRRLHAPLRELVFSNMGTRFVNFSQLFQKLNLTNPYSDISNILTNALTNVHIDDLNLFYETNASSDGYQLRVFVGGVPVTADIPGELSFLQMGPTQITDLTIDKHRMHVHLNLHFTNISIALNLTVSAHLFHPMFSLRQSKGWAVISVEEILVPLMIPFQLNFQRQQQSKKMTNSTVVGVLTPADFVTHGASMLGLRTTLLGCGNLGFVAKEVLRLEEHLSIALGMWLSGQPLTALAEALRHHLLRSTVQSATMAVSQGHRADDSVVS